MIFAPASITCIFSPHISDEPKSSGSIGVGFTINLGATARKSVRTTINKEEWSFSTLDYVIEKMPQIVKKLRELSPFVTEKSVS